MKIILVILVLSNIASLGLLGVAIKALSRAHKNCADAIAVAEASQAQAIEALRISSEWKQLAQRLH